MQVLHGRMSTGNRYRITPYVVNVSSPDGDVIRNVETQSIGDIHRRQSVVTCWMRDGSYFNLSFDSIDDAEQAMAVLQGGMRQGGILQDSATGLIAGITARQMAMAICALAIIIGSFGPWARVWVVTANGLDGDGKITIVLGILALVGVLTRVRQPDRRAWISIGLVGGFGVAAAIGGYDWSNIDSALSDLEDNPFAANASVGWGLQLLTISAVIGAILAFVEMIGARNDGGRY